MISKEKTLGLLFTRGVSFSVWDKVGNLKREILPYIKLSESFKEILFFTYGTEQEDSKYKRLFPENIKMVFRPGFIPVNIYVFLMPFYHRKIFKNIDMLKTNQMDGSWAGVIAKKLFNVKLVIRCGYEWYEFVARSGDRLKSAVARLVSSFSYRGADKIIITSIDDKEFIKGKFNISENKIEVIPNYIDVNHFKPLKKDKKEKTILYVGRLEMQKNLSIVIDALAGTDIALDIAGEGSLKEELRQKALSLNVSINFIGRVSQKVLPDLINEYTVFVLPSFYEGNPKALLEAMSCGLACIGNDVKGISSVIKDGMNGLLFRGSPESLREAILSLVRNPVMCENLGNSARKEVIENQSLETVIKMELELYKKI